MYGQAGGISAAVGALLILGRKNYGPPIDFAIARITEAVIGIICFITVVCRDCLMSCKSSNASETGIFS